MAKLFRTMMHTVSCNSLARLWGTVAADPVDVAPDIDGLPLESGSEHRKRTEGNRRPRRDPLGRRLAMTWRMSAIKVAARAETTTRMCV